MKMENEKLQEKFGLMKRIEILERQKKQSQEAATAYLHKHTQAQATITRLLGELDKKEATKNPDTGSLFWVQVIVAIFIVMAAIISFGAGAAYCCGGSVIG